MPTSISVLTQDHCVRKLKVLADATRLSVLSLLMQQPMRVGEINAILKLDQSLLSHHLKVLRSEGFVQATRDGKAMLYQIVTGEAEVSSAIDLGCCLLTFDPTSLNAVNLLSD